MYNRYIPQSDGSYCRTRLPDSPPRQPTSVQLRKNVPEQTENKEIETVKTSPSPAPCPKPAGCAKYSKQKPVPQNPPGSSVGSFLKQILPKNFDTGDLIVVLLLLLISGDNAEEQNNALLTLALYLFM